MRTARRLAALALVVAWPSLAAAGPVPDKNLEAAILKPPCTSTTRPS